MSRHIRNSDLRAYQIDGLKRLILQDEDILRQLERANPVNPRFREENRKGKRLAKQRLARNKKALENLLDSERT